MSGRISTYFRTFAGLVAILMLFGNKPAEGCTTAIVSGRYTPEGYLPFVPTSPPDEKASMTILAHDLINRMVPVKRGNGKNYLQTTAVINAEGTGILQQLESLHSTFHWYIDKLI